MASTDDEDAITSYNIHVSSRYLELTRRKLELTRLPHDVSFAHGSGWQWGTPKSEIEPLIDFWLDSYNWREQESLLNIALPQHRTKIQPVGPHPPLLVHFAHKRSPRPNAIPLLYCHGWPGGIFEVTKILDSLTVPEENRQAFHVVVPSIPGFGFSETDAAEQIGTRTVADIFNQLMRRLGYRCYVAHGSDLGFSTCRMLSINHADSCRAVHTATPLWTMQPPSARQHPLDWLRFRIARATKARFPGLRFGYVPDDFKATLPYRSSPSWQPAPLAMASMRPHAITFGLCDSPVGLLAYMKDAFYRRYPAGQAMTATESLNFVMLSWLPGPEGALRYLRQAFSSDSQDFQDMAGAYSRTPLGISAFPSRGGCPMWSRCVQDLAWIKRHGGDEGWPVWNRSVELAEDLRDFFGQTVWDRDPNLRAACEYDIRDIV